MECKEVWRVCTFLLRHSGQLRDRGGGGGAKFGIAVSLIFYLQPHMQMYTNQNPTYCETVFNLKSEILCCNCLVTKFF